MRIRPWQVWAVDLDPTEGREQAGVRPCLVVSSTEAMRLTGGALVTVVPMTSTARGWPHHVPVVLRSGLSHAMCDQPRTVTAQRFTGTQPLGTAGPEEIADVRFWLGRLIG